MQRSRPGLVAILRDREWLNFTDILETAADARRKPNALASFFRTRLRLAWYVIGPCNRACARNDLHFFAFVEDDESCQVSPNMSQFTSDQKLSR